MTVLLVTGVGGAGTTTAATAAAVRAARAGRSVLLLADPPARPELAEVPGLTVDPVAPTAAAQALWAGRSADLAALAPLLDLPPASSVVALPGLPELGLLAAVSAADAEVVVVDAGPLAAGTALVGLPAALHWWTAQLLPPRLRVLGLVRTAALRTGAGKPGAVDALLQALPALERLAELPLADPAATAVHLVTTARPDAVRATRRAVTALAVHGQRPAGVHARVLPAEAAGGWWAARAAEEEAALAGLPGVVRVPEAPAAPTGLEELLAAAPAIDAVPADGGRPEPERTDEGWRLTLPLPYAERDDVELTRWEDDLVLTAAGARRSLPLDSLLRRCSVSGARLEDAGTADAHLAVRFVPDRQQWPADLFAAVTAGVTEGRSR